MESLEKEDKLLFALEGGEVLGRRSRRVDLFRKGEEGCLEQTGAE